MLTKRLSDLLVFVAKRIDETGIMPSYEEMCAGIGLVSKSGVHRMVLQLVERGYIERIPNRARAIKIIRMPEVTNMGEEFLLNSARMLSLAQLEMIVAEKRGQAA